MSNERSVDSVGGSTHHAAAQQTAEVSYPYYAWVLLPSFKPKQVMLIERYASYSSVDYGDVSDSGKCYSRSDIHLTKQAAIAAGHKALSLQQDRIDKMIHAMAKKRAALTKAEAA